MPDISPPFIISAVIPVYNGERFLAETIDSVLGQTYPNLECIVVDDGSTDETASIVRSYGGRVRYVEKPNGGVSSARNLGIKTATGQLIAFLDADDLWRPDKIEHQVEIFLRNQDVGLIYSAVRLVDETGSVISEVRDRFGKNILERILLLETPSYLTMTGVVPKRVFDDVGYFDEQLSTSADADMACRIALKYRTVAIDEPLADYRQHGGQMHLNLAALDHDAHVLFQKVFEMHDLPNEIAKLRSKAYASLDSTLAIGYFSKREFRNGGRHLLRSIRSSPSTTVRKFLQLFNFS